MRILMTNADLDLRAGTQLYTLDVARWLRDHGHAPVAYSARLGRVADELRREAIPVIDDLASLAEPPDVIHGQHHVPTMTALARFPLVPAISVCHGWLPWRNCRPDTRRSAATSRSAPSPGSGWSP